MHDKPSLLWSAKRTRNGRCLLKRPTEAIEALNHKEKLFCNYLAMYEDYEKATNLAGYPKVKGKSLGQRLASRPNISAYITYLMAKKMDKEIVDYCWKLQKLKEVVEGCLTGQASERPIEPKGAISAIAEMNKMQGDYKPSLLEITNKTDAEQFKRLCEEYAKEF